jgi:hypothetical protein
MYYHISTLKYWRVTNIVYLYIKITSKLDVRYRLYIIIRMLTILDFCKYMLGVKIHTKLWCLWCQLFENFFLFFSYKDYIQNMYIYHTYKDRSVNIHHTYKDRSVNITSIYYGACIKILVLLWMLWNHSASHLINYC